MNIYKLTHTINGEVLEGTSPELEKLSVSFNSQALALAHKKGTTIAGFKVEVIDRKYVGKRTYDYRHTTKYNKNVDLWDREARKRGISYGQLELQIRTTHEREARAKKMTYEQYIAYLQSEAKKHGMNYDKYVFHLLAEREREARDNEYKGDNTKAVRYSRTRGGKKG